MRSNIPADGKVYGEIPSTPEVQDMYRNQDATDQVGFPFQGYTDRTRKKSTKRKH